MLDAVLSRCKLGLRISVKSAISALLIALAVVLPQIAHASGGAEAGAVYLPMYAPALLAGCLLGPIWGVGVGVLSPIVSFALTSLFMANPMPTAERLPVMILELLVFGLLSGLFAKKIEKNPYLAFPVVALAQVSGRAVYLVYNLIAGRTFAALISTVQTGLPGLYIQLILVPLIVICLSTLCKEKKDEK